MNLIINGQAKDVEETAGANVCALLEFLDLQAPATVVELNGNIVDKILFETTVLNEGDRLELVRFVGGG